MKAYRPSDSASRRVTLGRCQAGQAESANQTSMLRPPRELSIPLARENPYWRFWRNGVDS